MFPELKMNLVIEELEAIDAAANRTTREAAVDMSAYPILTEELGYPPSPLAAPSAGQPPASGAGAPLGQIAAKAVADVLGWKPKQGDAKGFIGALTQSFSLTDVEGHVEAKWTPRTYAVQTDLSGGISGAQASIYARANEAVNQSLPLLDGLYPLDTEADDQIIASIKAIVRNQLTELAAELGLSGGPRVSRVQQLFQLLFGHPFPRIVPRQPVLNGLETEPDNIGGQLGKLRDEMGLWSVVIANPQLTNKRTILINTVEEEQNVTNYRIVVDYLTSLRQNWINSQQFFGLRTTTPFFGTQLVLLSRQMSVVADSVDQVRFTLDSVFVTAAERQTLEIDFPHNVTLPFRPGRPANTADHHVHSQPLFLEDMLSWVQRFSTEEGPRLVQDGGKFGVSSSVLPTVLVLRNLTLAALHPQNHADLPKGYHTPRVRRAMQDLAAQLDDLALLCSPITIPVPPQE